MYIHTYYHIYMLLQKITAVWPTKPSSDDDFEVRSDFGAKIYNVLVLKPYLTPYIIHTHLYNHNICRYTIHTCTHIFISIHTHIHTHTYIYIYIYIYIH